MKKHFRERIRFLVTGLLSGLFFAGVTFAQGTVTAHEALVRLKAGNQRFVEGRSDHPRQDISRIKEVASAQRPFATIIGCSDFRVPNEIIFDQGLGDLFIVRTAGQVSTYASWGSIEFAEEVFGTRLIVVLGHTKCGAVSAAVNLPEVPGHIVTLVNAIKPAVDQARRDNLPIFWMQPSVRMSSCRLSSLKPLNLCWPNGPGGLNQDRWSRLSPGFRAS